MGHVPHIKVDVQRSVDMTYQEKFCTCSQAELRAMPDGVLDKVKSFFAALTMDDAWTPVRDEDGEIIYGVLASGMNNLNLSWWPHLFAR
ncbi:unnamed protein product [Symbiodinium natans]|uniref:Uncharacterized protein n=1 Tax=Symbiodinium natans TaxID=878477 RepID=A0A812GR12_9DINO|nr:unnamed protein product [Symbiodinium natans]